MNDWCLVLLIVALSTVLVAWLRLRRSTSRAYRHLAKNPERTSEVFASAYFTGDHAEIAARVHKVFLTVAPLDAKCVHPDDRLVDDLCLDDLDSMATVEFVVALEKEFNLKLPDLAMARARTLRDIIEYLKAPLSPQP